jgi:hypothetical protein
MQTYVIRYSGQNRKFKFFLGRVEINANSPREAVFNFYLSRFQCFECNGNLQNQDGDILIRPSEDQIYYDGGYFYADPLPSVDWWDRDKTLLVSGVYSREDLVSAVNAFLDNYPGSAAVFTKVVPDNENWFVPVLWL